MKNTEEKRGRGRPRKYVEHRGGAREGAGRKALPEGEAKVSMTLYISPRTRDICKQLKDRGFTVSGYFEKCIDKMAQTLFPDE